MTRCQEILALMDEQKKVTSDSVAEDLDLNTRYARRLLAYLRQRDLIQVYDWVQHPENGKWCAVYTRVTDKPRHKKKPCLGEREVCRRYRARRVRRAPSIFAMADTMARVYPFICGSRSTHEEQPVS